MLIQFYAEKLLFKACHGSGLVVLTAYLLLVCPGGTPGQGELDRVGGRFSAWLWQELTRGSIYKIDVVLSASPSYCGNHIPIFTKNKIHPLPLRLPQAPARTYLSLQETLRLLSLSSNIKFVQNIFRGIRHGFSSLAYQSVSICPCSIDNKFSGFLVVLVLCWEYRPARVSQSE